MIRASDPKQELLPYYLNVCMNRKDDRIYNRWVYIYEEDRKPLQKPVWRKALRKVGAGGASRLRGAQNIFCDADNSEDALWREHTDHVQS